MRRRAYAVALALLLVAFAFLLVAPLSVLTFVPDWALSVFLPRVASE